MENRKDTDVSHSSLTGFLAQGDVLLIIPPFVDPKIPSLGGHILQASCGRVGVTAKVFYAGMDFANLSGFKFYETVMSVNQATFIGERLFAASAFDLPPMGRNLGKLFEPGYVPDHVWQKNRAFVSRHMPEIFDPIRNWAAAVDWDRMENLAARWTVSMAAQIAEMGYRIVGCSTTQGGLIPAIALLNQVKQAAPDIVTILGGSLCEGEMAEGIVSLKTGVDYVFSGEGEVTFPIFTRDVLAGHMPGEKVIYGVPLENLDDTPLPDYGEFFSQRKRLWPDEPEMGNNFRLPYEASRGCQWGRCTFCGLNGKRDAYRVKSPDKVIEDLGQLSGRYGINRFQMTDNILPLQYFKTLVPRLPKELPGIDILYEVKANMKLERLLALKEAGIKEVQPGIEALSDSLLKRIRKGVTVREIIALLRCARAVGVKLYWNLLFGFPGDKTAEYEEMVHLIPLLHHLQPPDRFTSSKIFRFSQYQETPEAFGISNLRPAGFHKDVFPAHADLEKIAYYFVGDYDAQSYENPRVIAELHKVFQEWCDEWGPYEYAGVEALLPVLHIERETSGRFVLHDTRGLPGRPEKMVLDKEQTGILLIACPLNDQIACPLNDQQDKEKFQWAVDAKLAIIRDSWFIPLATAEPELLLEFEREYKPGG